MNIEHLIISGGGPVFGLYVYGVLNRLFNDNILSYAKLKTIHGCSAGSIIGLLVCLKYDWSDLTEYIIGKPWDRIVNIEPEDILNMHNEKGVLERKFFEEIFFSLLLAKDLDVDLTLKDLYDFSGIDLHIYTTKVSSFEYVDVSHSTHPDLQVVDAVYMSSAIPFIFKPVRTCGDYFIDGGVIKNFPFDSFKEKNHDVLHDNILGITLRHRENKIDCEDMSILEYASFIYRNQLILLDRQNAEPKHLIDITIDFSELFNFFTIFRNSSMRDEIINKKSKYVVRDFLEKSKDYQSQ